MEKRKHPKQKARFDVKRMMKEREEYYKNLEEVEKLRNLYHQSVAEDEAREKEEAVMKNTQKKEVVSTLKILKDEHPGREVFFEEHRCQCFKIDRIEKLRLPNGCSYNHLRILLENRMEANHVITNETIFNMFLLMSLDNDETVVDSCYELLKKNVKNFAPRLRQVVKVFLNWGATFESLNINEGEKAEFFFKKCIKTPDPSVTFRSFNFTSVFNYIGDVCAANPECFSKSEKAILLKCLFRISLDKELLKLTASISSCVSKVVESFPQWDDFTVANLCRIIHDDKDHFHNQVAVILYTLPKMNRCNDLLSCICYYVFHLLLQLKPKYVFPYDDKKIVELVKAININPNDGDDLYRLYVLIQLLNYMVYHRNIFNNPKVLKDIKDALQEVIVTVASSTKTFDAAFVKGRISYCSSIWSLQGRTKLDL